eukprot:tig00021348_g20547.t1
MSAPETLPLLGSANEAALTSKWGNLRKAAKTATAVQRIMTKKKSRGLNVQVLGGLEPLLSVPTVDAGYEPGSAEALQNLASGLGDVRIQCCDYSDSMLEEKTVEPSKLREFLAQARPKNSRVRWIQVEGADPSAMQQLARAFQMSELTLDDAFSEGQLAKVDFFSGANGEGSAFFFIAMMPPVKGRPQSATPNPASSATPTPEPSVSGGYAVDSSSPFGLEQISVYCTRDAVISFRRDSNHAAPGLGAPRYRPMFAGVVKRLRNPLSKLRTNDASFLSYALLDALVDAYFPVLEAYQEHVESLDDEVMRRPSVETILRIHALQRELLRLRRAVLPLRDLVGELRTTPHECVSQCTRDYLRRVQDHVKQILELVENFRDFGESARGVCNDVMAQRLNEIVKTLTIVSVIFTPLTFLAGVYGMNLEFIPELHWPISYPAFWTVCLAISGALLLSFRRRGWM